VTGQPRRVRPGADRTPQQRAAAELLELRLRLDAITELHSVNSTGWCPACLLEHPCQTYRMATGDVPVTQL
jgi:hypothetical protein